MNARNTIIAYLLVLLAGLIAATQWVGYRLDYHPDLGGLLLPDRSFTRRGRSSRGHGTSDRTSRARSMRDMPSSAAAFILATLMLVAGRRLRRRIPVREIGKDRWASKSDMKRAGLLTGQGTVLGCAHNRYLTYDGPEHQLGFRGQSIGQRRRSRHPDLAELERQRAGVRREE